MGEGGSTNNNFSLANRKTMNKLLLGAGLLALITLAAVWLHSLLHERTLRKRWEICVAQAAQIVANVKAQYPGCEGALNAITADSVQSTAESDGGLTSAHVSGKDGDLAFEHYLDLLDMNQPESTPFYSTIGRSPRGRDPEGVELDMQNHQFAWSLDAPETPDGAVGVGDNYAIQSSEYLGVLDNQEKMGNIGQAFRRASGVGWIADAVVNTPGGRLIVRAQNKVNQRLKQTLEAACCSLDQIAVAPTSSGSATGGVMAGFRKLVDRANRYTDAATGFAYGKPTPNYFAPTAASFTGALSSTFTYAAINSAMRAIRETAGEVADYVLLAGLDAGDQITQFVNPATTSATGGALATTVIRAFTQSQNDTTYGFSVGLLRTEYGMVEVMRTERIGYTLVDSAGAGTNVRLSRLGGFLKKQKGFMLYRPQDWRWHWGKRFETVDQPDLGGGKSFLTRCYGSLRTKNPTRAGFGDMS